MGTSIEEVEKKLEIARALVNLGKEPTSKELTAVEYLINELSDIIGPIEATISGELLLAGAIERAKEKGKEQLKDAYDAGVWDVGCKAPNFDEYYKRTFKSE